MNKRKEITISKTIKVPIPGVQFSNKQVEVGVVYEAEGFDIVKAVDEINQMLTIAKESDPSWIHQMSINEVGAKEEEVKT